MPAQLVSIIVAAGSSSDEQRMLATPSTLRAAERSCGAPLEFEASGTVSAAITTDGRALDHGERAGRCAMALRALLPSAIVGMATSRAGEHTDDELRRRAGVLVVPRPDASTAPGTIRVDDETAACLGSRFDLTVDAGHLLLTGERDDDTGAAPTLLGRPTAFVGRERELRMLSSAFDECVTDGAARVVLVTGPAGSGKSRLLCELAREIAHSDQPVEVWRARGDAMRSASPLALISALLARTAAIPPDVSTGSRARVLRARVARHIEVARVDAVTDALSAMLEMPCEEQVVTAPLEGHDATARSLAIQVAWQQLVTAECRVQPLAIILDDVQWSDRASLRLLDCALQSSREFPLIVVAAARPDLADRVQKLWARHQPRSVHVRDLAASARESLIRAGLESRAGKPEFADISARSTGNPFVLEELIRAAHSRRRVVVATLEGVARDRFRSLASAQQRMLAVASVFGGTFWSGGLEAAIADTDAHARSLDALVESELLEFRAASTYRGETEFVFRDLPIRDAAYESLSEAERRSLHARAGEWLYAAGERDPALLAHHFAHGGDRERAARLYRSAAVRACDHQDFATASELSEHAIASGAGAGDREVLETVASRIHESIRDRDAP